jgi:hypothetical protein
MLVFKFLSLLLATLCLPITDGSKGWLTLIPEKLSIVVPSDDPEGYFEGTTPDFKLKGHPNAFTPAPPSNVNAESARDDRKHAFSPNERDHEARRKRVKVLNSAADREEEDDWQIDLQFEMDVSSPEEYYSVNGSPVKIPGAVAFKPKD